MVAPRPPPPPPLRKRERERERERKRDTENFGDANPLPATCIVDGGTTTYFYSFERETERGTERPLELRIHFLPHVT